MTIQYKLIEDGTIAPPSLPRSMRYKKFQALDTDTGEPLTVYEWAKRIIENPIVSDTLSYLFLPAQGEEQPDLHAHSHTAKAVASSSSDPSNYAAVFFETPVATAKTAKTQHMEFVFVDAPQLYRFVQRIGPDAHAFEEHFQKCNTELGETAVQVTTACAFSNLGGTSVLISPRPLESSSSSTTVEPNLAMYTDLASFIRGGVVNSKTENATTISTFHRQVRETWQLATYELLHRLGLEPENESTHGQRQDDSHPVWFSTSGMGVPWLHFRLDHRPKYYTFTPYKLQEHSSP